MNTDDLFITIVIFAIIALCFGLGIALAELRQANRTYKEYQAKLKSISPVRSCEPGQVPNWINNTVSGSGDTAARDGGAYLAGSFGNPCAEFDSSGVESRHAQQRSSELTRKTGDGEQKSASTLSNEAATVPIIGGSSVLTPHARRDDGFVCLMDSRSSDRPAIKTHGASGSLPECARIG